MNLPSNLAKSSVLAFVIFWVIIGSKDYESEVLPYVMLSYIPVFLCVLIVIIGTICPFFWSAKNTGFNNQNVFKTCFPYYAIVVFGICVFGISTSDFDNMAIAFFTSVFITTSQSWIWFAKEKTK